MSDDIREAIDFSLRLGRAMQTYGAPAHRLEETMFELTRRIGIRGNFFSMPTGIIASFEKENQHHTEIVRIESTQVDLGRLSSLDDLADRVTSGRLTLEQGALEIDRILATPERYSVLMTLAAFSLSSAAASRFFGAGIVEILLAFTTGLAVGLLALAAPRVPAIARLFDPLAGFTVSFFAVLGAALIGGASVPIVTVAGLIVLVPGLTLTVAITELAQRSLVSGTARLHGAFLVFLMLGFGVATGGQLATLMVGALPDTAPTVLAPWTLWLAVAVSCLSLTVLLKAPARDLGWISIVNVLTFAAVHFSSGRLGPELGVFVGALVAGVASNLYARRLDRPAAVTRLPAMMLLVPGGLGFIGLSSLLEQDVLTGIRTAFSVAIIAVALVTGLIIASALISPRRAL